MPASSILRIGMTPWMHYPIAFGAKCHLPHLDPAWYGLREEGLDSRNHFEVHQIPLVPLVFLTNPPSIKTQHTAPINKIDVTTYPQASLLTVL